MAGGDGGGGGDGGDNNDYDDIELIILMWLRYPLFPLCDCGVMASVWRAVEGYRANVLMLSFCIFSNCHIARIRLCLAHATQ